MECGVCCCMAAFSRFMRSMAACSGPFFRGGAFGGESCLLGSVCWGSKEVWVVLDVLVDELVESDWSGRLEVVVVGIARLVWRRSAKGSSPCLVAWR